jgi:microcystin-dependent protein
MTDLTETGGWVDGVYQIEQTDPVVGGPPDLANGGGIANVQAEQLAKRTAYLKSIIDALGAASALGVSANANLNIDGPKLATREVIRLAIAGELEALGDASDYDVSVDADLAVDGGMLATRAVIAAAIAASLASLDGLTPAGTIIYQAGNAAPSGFLKANGASLNTTTYADLLAVIGYTFGGSGTSFTLPDLRGEFVRGWDDARGVDAGRVFGSAQADEFRAHAHQFSAYANTDSNRERDNNPGAGSLTTQPTAYTGGNETRPRNIALLACIKY